MSVIPVIDLMHGVVVRGVAGRRDQYRPLQSRLCDNPRPQSVARCLAESFAFDSLYVADLDAIGGGPPNWKAYVEMASCGPRLLIDAGIGSLAAAERLLQDGLRKTASAGVVVGLETLSSVRELAGLAEVLTARQAVFSLDLKHGRPLTSIPDWQGATPLEIARAAVEGGFGRLIVLDLAAVGVHQGPSVHALCAQLRKEHPTIELVSGGGVRHVSDVRRLLECGCDRVLVASALHEGGLTLHDLVALEAELTPDHNARR